MRLLYRSLLGPQLYRICKTHTTEGFAYTPNGMENWGDRIMSFVSLMYKTTLWTSPLVGVYLLWRGYLSYAGAVSLVRLAASAGTLMAAAAVLRAVGRATNIQYRLFLEVLHDTDHEDYRRKLAGYDFEMFAWPVDYTATSVPEFPGEGGLPTPLLTGSLTSMPGRLLVWLATHTIGRRLMYPGSMAFMNSLLAPALLEGRTKMVEELGGARFLLQTTDGSRIDTMFVDRRQRGRSDGAGGPGDKLVICCEGNAGFYEIGATSAPLEAGYSVLGWNHPGFGGSSGVPTPESEQAAISAVMEFAQWRLGFLAEDIVLYAWSIGGYAATFAAMTHPDISALVLDATFDDVTPIAVSRMPPSWAPLVRASCTRHLQLNNGRQLTHYPGPVLIVRRSMDEVITTVEQDVSTNRANDLLLLLMRVRFPGLVDDVTTPQLESWVRGDSTTQAEVVSEVGVEEDLCHSLLVSYVCQHSASLPLRIGPDLDAALRTQLAVYLASKLMVDMEGTHCTPMSGSFFRMPWELPHNANGFVYVDKPDSN